MAGGERWELAVVVAVGVVVVAVVVVGGADVAGGDGNLVLVT